MKTLIVYYSFTHNNEFLAKELQRKLNCDLYRIEERKKRSGFTIMLDLIFHRKPAIKPYPYPIGSFDHCIFVAPVWAGNVASPLKTFLSEHKYFIKDYSFITVCGGYPGQKDKLTRGLTQLVEHEPKAVQELWVNDLLPDDMKNTIKFTSGYRLQEQDLWVFESQITTFLKSITTVTTPANKKETHGVR